jgi:NinB protein
VSGPGVPIVLAGIHTRAAACQAVREAPSGFVVRIEAPPRSSDQSSKFYALCSQLAGSALTWDNERQSKRGWHDLLLHGWMLATDRNPRLVAGLNGGRVSLLMSSREMTKAEMAELIDFSLAWAAEKGIEINE